jgi:hypothetical protein
MNELLRLNERDQWDVRLLRGECTLEDALAMSMHLCVPLSPLLIARVELAFDNHRQGGVQLAVSFGCDRAGNEAQSIRAGLVRRQAYALVLELHQEHPKGHGEHLALTLSSALTKKTGSTAFKRAAEILKVSEDTVKKHYNAERKLVADRRKG